MADVTKKSKQSMIWLPALITIVGILVSIFLYSYLIWSNCDSNGLGDFFTDVRHFHTSLGC